MGHIKRGLIGIVAAAALLLAAGCTATVGDSSKNLRVMLWGNSTDIASIKAPAAAFEKAHPDIKITWETGDCGVDYAACKTLIAGKNMPDVVVPGSWNYFDMVNDGVIADLGPFVKKSGLNLGDFTPLVIKALTSPKDDTVHALPMGYNVQSLYYNKAMFAAAGLAEPPADGSYTYDDLREWSKKLTIDENGNNAESPNFNPQKIKQYGYFNFAAGLIQPGYAPILAAFGGGILGGKLGNQCIIDKQQTIDAFQYIQDLMWKDHSTITPQLQQEEPGYSRWIKGQVAMQQGSHEQVQQVADQNPTLKYDMTALPRGSAGNATLIQIHNWAMYQGSKNKDTAWEFIKYMATDGSGKQMGLIPAYKDVALGTAFAQAPGEPSHLVEAQVKPAGWPQSFTNVDPASVWAAVSGQDGFGPALEDIMSNRKTAEQALSGLCASKIDSVLKLQKK